MTNAEWQLSGNMAERYEEYLVPVIFAPWANDLIARAGLVSGDSLLDLACGTGIVARLATRSGVMATGGDINPGMLAVAEERSAGLDATFHSADAQDLPFEDESFDAVICQQGLQFFPDKLGALSECLRVIKPGGQAVFCTARGLEENPLMQAQVTAFGRHFGEETTGAIRAVCGFPDPDEMRSVFESAGFGQVAVEKVVLDLEAEDGSAFVNGLMMATPVADRIAAMTPADRTTLHDDILKGFGTCYDGAALRFPHSANVVVASRSV